ncbi:nuclease HARBI1 [Trichonephila clavata]|uniref:Nuclease HARBI1 n=1 Tax=Trichonephila clavata TaxID=2740835 RepID=A0A8X6KXL7_TRICU|nr:nuclease HARBI1 [Trichonephila clavata]
MDDCFDFFLLEVLETLESIERRSIFIPEHRSNDLDELDEDDFRRRYRFYKGTIETLVELLRTKLDSATGRNHALTAAEKVLAAVRFFAFVVRWPGSTHDSTVFDHSYLRAHLETEVPSSYHLLGDSGYPLRSYLMTPFLNPVGAGQVRYNAAHARARNVIERQYGVWKKRFSCIDTPFRCSLETAQTVIVATAVLHNFALSLGDYEDEDSLSLQQDETMVNHSQEHGRVAKRNAIVAIFFN